MDREKEVIEELSKVLKRHFQIIAADSISLSFWTAKAKALLAEGYYYKERPAPSKEGLRELDEEGLYKFFLEWLYEPIDEKEKNPHQINYRNLTKRICAKFGVKKPAKPTPPVKELKPYPEMPSEKWDKKAPPVEVTLEDIKEALRPIPSTAYPICDIDGKHYYYMCKDDIATAIHNLIYNQKRTG